MKVATLAIVIQDGKLLLGEKKKGEIGTGVLCGPGGKVDPGETPDECVIRETREELGIELDPASLMLAAHIDFYAARDLDFRVHVFRAQIASGDLIETADMIPGWYPLGNLPFNRMYESDRLWMGKVICGEQFDANVYYRSRARELDHVDFLPFTP